MNGGAGRLLAAALCAAAVCASFSIATAAELGEPITDETGGPATGWITQHWPMHGQSGDQRRVVTAEFTNAQFRTFAGTMAYPGTSWVRTFFDVFTGEIATGYVPSALSPIGPHGVFSLLSRNQMYIGAPSAGFLNYSYVYPYSSYFNLPSPCGNYIGSPILIPDEQVVLYNTGQSTVPVGFFSVYGLTDCNRLNRTIFATAYFQLAPTGGGPPTPIVFCGEQDNDSFLLSGEPLFSPVLDNGVIYAAVRRIGPLTVNGVYDERVQQSGVLSAISPGSLAAPMSEIWSAGLQIGSGSTGPLPKGQEPPPAAERFWPTTPPAVGAGLVVVGCRGWKDDFSAGFLQEVHAGYVLFAFDAATGAQRWTYAFDAEILSTPAITDDLIILGTRNGRAYAITHGGFLQWQTGYNERVTYRTHPFSAPQQFANAALYGPAIDEAGNNAYFGGSDGRVHQFSIGSGGLRSSEVLAYFREPGRRDANGLEIVRPVRISSAPAVYRDQMVLVKYHTNTQDTSQNGSFLAALKAPDLTFNPNIRDAPSGTALNPDQATFTGGGTWGAVSLSGASGILMGYHPIYQVSYIDNAGFNMVFSNGDETDSGGVSFGDGFAMGTDGSGAFVLIPSSVNYVPPAPTGVVTPKPPTAGPGADPGPPPLGPVEAFPNPFMPSRARGGTFKFRNLPMGSRVELYTLAFERVKTLTESGNRAEWDATNEAGQPVTTGVYLYKIFFPDDRPPMTGRVALTR